MRRLSMKNKRRKSETTSDSGSEENGVTRTIAADNNVEVMEEKEAGDGETGTIDGKTSVTSSTATSQLQQNQQSQQSQQSHQHQQQQQQQQQQQRKSPARKKQLRGRHGQKGASEDNVHGDTRQNETDENPGQTENKEEENGNVGKGGASKRRKKEELKASTSTQNDEGASEKEYEVEKIVGQRTIKGRRQFLVRWKGYGEDSDTWEQEKDLNCSKLIEQFIAEDAESEQDQEPEKPAKQGKAIKNKITKPPPEKKTKKLRTGNKRVVSKTENDKQSLSVEDIKNDKDSQKEFEVEKILEVHFKKNKTREFLIRWKGFTSADDTWEPEENLNCPDLIAKFMQKVEKAKTTDVRELRTNRAHTKRYTLTTHESGRRLSRRNMDKQRATYHECDE